MTGMGVKNLSTPDELRELAKTQIKVVNPEGVTVMRATFQPDGIH
ncbi:cupin domain-containing protein [Legionella hackeliae]|uniref:Cupin 2 conserved barrel domain protein n=1 Tax=Legionella hackeliae TaxID=449 RepID=A0A0A8UVP8_LEGHA